MKYVKMFGLAAMAATAMMSLVGGTASATILCSVEPAEGSPGTKGTVCPLNKAWGAGTEIHAVLDAGEDFTIWDDEGRADVTCKKSTISATTENEGSVTETVRANVGALSFEECTSPAFSNSPCTVTTLKKGTLEVHWIADTFNGTVTSTGAEITTLCKTLVGNIHCIYGTSSTDLGTITGGAMVGEKGTWDIPKLSFPKLPTEGACPVNAFVEAKYEITSPKPLYVAAHT